jgi:hypothetical protein
MWHEEHILGAAAEEIISTSELGHNSLFPHSFQFFPALIKLLFDTVEMKQI